MLAEQLQTTAGLEYIRARQAVDEVNLKRLAQGRPPSLILLGDRNVHRTVRCEHVS
jgi:hypothetical protein